MLLTYMARFAKVIFVIVGLLGVYLFIEFLNMWSHESAHKKMEEIQRKEKLSHENARKTIVSRKKAAVKGSVLPDLSKILQSDSILITNEWVGYSKIGRRQAHYTLKRNGTAFHGEARFSVGWNDEKSTTTIIKIPLKAVQEFLKILSETPLEEGSYKPRIEVTDSYPKIKIELETKEERFVFWTESQGADHIPWGVRFAGKEYVANSGVPASALNVLAPYLKEDVLGKLIKEIDKKS